METKTTYAATKKVYTSDADAQQRGFFAYLRRLQQDASAAEAASKTQTSALAAADAAKAAQDAQKAAQKAAKAAARADASAEAKDAAEAKARAAAEAKDAADAAKKAADAAKAAEAEAAKKADAKTRSAAIDALREVMLKKHLRAADFCKEFLLENIPRRFNADKQICKVTRVELADEAKTREDYKNALSMLVEAEDGYLYIYKPILLFTANSLLTEFTRAADAKTRRAAEAKAAEAEAQKAAKAKAAEDAILRRAAEINAKREAAQKAAEAAEAEAAQTSGSK